jgi:steroid delta-isomerase-like uncharacterized protein
VIIFSLEKNKALFRRYTEEIWNSGNLTAMDEILVKDFIFRRVVGDLKGHEALKTYITAVRAAFPDLHFTIEDQVAERDKIISVWTMTGTHKGEFMGIAPTDKKIRLQGTSMACVDEGKMMFCQTYWDRLFLMQQLGVIPR